MSDRELQRLDFLMSAGLSDAARTPLPGDASTRRYERLTTPSGSTLMLMDQPPAAESLLPDSTKGFLAVEPDNLDVGDNDSGF